MSINEEYTNPSYTVPFLMIIASVSTIPGRVDGLFRVLSALPRQTRRPDRLIVTVSKFYPRMGKAYPDDDKQRITTFLESYPIPAFLMEPEVDVGPVVKLTSVVRYMQNEGLDKEAHRHQIYIFDDDSVPFPPAIEMLSGTHERFRQHHEPLAVYGLMGANDERVEDGSPRPEPTFVHGEFIMNGDYYPVDILGGYRGILYPAEVLFPVPDATPGTPESVGLMQWVQPFLEAHAKENLIAMHDDHIFAYYCRYRGVPHRVIRIPGAEGMIFYEPIENKDGIFNDDRSGRSYELFHEVLRTVYHMHGM